MRNGRSAQEAKKRLQQQKHTVEDQILQNLLQQLDNADSVTRAEIINNLDKLGTDAALREIGEFLVDESEVVRRTVARILTRKHPRYVEFLHKIVLESSMAMRFAALDLIQVDQGEHHLRVLTRCIDDAQPLEIQEKAVNILKSFPNLEAKLITHFWYQRRYEQINRTEYAVEEAEIEEIREFLEDISETNRLALEEEYLGPKTPVNYLNTFETLFQFVRRGQWGDQQVAVNTVQQLIQDITVDLGAEYIKIRQYLVDNLNDPAQMVRWVIIEALTALQDRDTIDAIVPHLKDPSWTVRVATIQALVAMDSRLLGKEIASCINDPNVTVRITAIEAIGTLGSRRQTGIITQVLMYSKDKNERLAAIETLLKMNATRVFPTLLHVLRDDDVVIRWHAARALSILADPSCDTWADELVFHLTDTSRPGDADTRVSDLVYEALVHINSPSTRNILKRWQTQSNAYRD